MDLWYTRSDSGGTRQYVRVTRPLFSEEGKSGRIDVLETEDFGKALVAGGEIVLTEADGFAQREMLVHVPLNVHPSPHSVLAIGGGGACTEILRYAAVERAVLVEDDRVLSEAMRRFFPELSPPSENPRIRVETENPTTYVRDSRERFDLIIIENSGRAEASYDQAFFCDCFRLLAGDGILVLPCGSAFFPARRRELVSVAGKLKRLFPIFAIYRVDAPISDGGTRLTGFASKKFDPLRDFDAATWPNRGISTKYYDAEVHRASFALPVFVKEALASA